VGKVSVGENNFLWNFGWQHAGVDTLWIKWAGIGDIIGDNNLPRATVCVYSDVKEILLEAPDVYDDYLTSLNKYRSEVQESEVPNDNTAATYTCQFPWGLVLFWRESVGKSWLPRFAVNADEKPSCRNLQRIGCINLAGYNEPNYGDENDDYDYTDSYCGCSGSKNLGKKNLPTISSEREDWWFTLIRDDNKVNITSKLKMKITLT